MTKIHHLTVLCGCKCCIVVQDCIIRTQSHLGAAAAAVTPAKTASAPMQVNKPAEAEPSGTPAAHQDEEVAPEAAAVRYITRFRQQSSSLPHPTLGNVDSYAGQDLIQQYRMTRSRLRQQLQQQQLTTAPTPTPSNAAKTVDKRARTAEEAAAGKRARTVQQDSELIAARSSSRHRSSSIPPNSKVAANRGRMPITDAHGSGRSSSVDAIRINNAANNSGSRASGSSKVSSSETGRSSKISSKAGSDRVQELVEGSGVYEAERIEAEKFDNKSKQVGHSFMQ